MLLPAMLCIRAHFDDVQQQRHHAGVTPVIHKSYQTQIAWFLLQHERKLDKMSAHGVHLKLDNARKAVGMRGPVGKLQQDQSAFLHEVVSRDFQN